MQLSLKEQDVCLFFLKTKSYKETAKLLGEKWKRDYRPKTVQIWIERKERVREYLSEQLRREQDWRMYQEFDMGFDLIAGFKGEKRLTPEQLQCAKLVQGLKGWIRAESSNTQNVQINFTQGDGNA